jgi:hypothetical protein
VLLRLALLRHAGIDHMQSSCYYLFRHCTLFPVFLLPFISSIASASIVWRWHCNSMTSTCSLLLAVCSV